MSSKFSKFPKFLVAVVFSTLIISGCGVEAAKDKPAGGRENVQPETSIAGEPKKSLSATIKIEPNSPADTVRVFYKNLREKKFREAMFLTNLRPAIESLSDAELKELHVDFEPLANQVPADIAINGEIISENRATVTADLPDVETDKVSLQEIKLRRENGVWIILTVDERAESEIKKEGKNYFSALRIKTHHEEAKAMLERVHKAQMVFATQNGGLYADLATLTEKGFLPKDVLTTETTGYQYQIQLSSDAKKFAATATPAVYGKTGKLSFRFEADGNRVSSLKSLDNKGQTSRM